MAASVLRDAAIVGLWVELRGVAGGSSSTDRKCIRSGCRPVCRYLRSPSFSINPR
jgi:hypothetical protein